jgi:hypothetical protein
MNKQTREQSVDACEKVLAELEKHRADLVAKGAAIDECRKRDAYAAYALAEPQARENLAATNAEAATSGLRSRSPASNGPPYVEGPLRARLRMEREAREAKGFTT